MVLIFESLSNWIVAGVTPSCLALAVNTSSLSNPEAMVGAGVPGTEGLEQKGMNKLRMIYKRSHSGSPLWRIEILLDTSNGLDSFV